MFIVLTTTAFCVVGFKTLDNTALAVDGQSKGNGTLNNHAYVDLGLPSGTMWATCNIGASKPEGCGYYFAWGESSPKSIYNTKNYKYARSRRLKLTKYCTQKDKGYRGFTDNLSTLEPSDDAATVNWGKGWRTPTLDDWSELFQHTRHEYAQIGLVRGHRFYGSNGKSIFLPAAGSWQKNDEPYNVNTVGGYWSSSVLEEDPTYAGEIYFDMYADAQGRPRWVGLSVRPVCSISN